jgi:hypothetical protein
MGAAMARALQLPADTARKLAKRQLGDAHKLIGVLP